MASGAVSSHSAATTIPDAVPDKEQWEPLISEVFRLQHGKAPHLRIHEAWSVDRQNHGDAALLNKEELAKSRPGGVCRSP
jgi:hypothetical protein